MLLSSLPSLHVVLFYVPETRPPRATGQDENLRITPENKFTVLIDTVLEEDEK
jgi:hypothetical protein